ncbi:hypothetical protein NMG60_11002491 [Bertholletia excelsa]
MQDPSMYQQMKPQFPEHEQLKCPRCDSTNTKFCYYNNYNLSQPRHFCKNCRRYWTKGGALRNIPVGGGSRKNTKRNSNPKRPSSSSTSSTAPAPEPPSSAAQGGAKPEPSVGFGFSEAGLDPERRILDVGGGSLSFSSLLASNGVGQFGNFMGALDPNGSTGQLGGYGEGPNSNSESGMIRNPQSELQSTGDSESFLGVQSGGDSGCWGGGNGWPDLAIYTPGSTFQ